VPFIMNDIASRGLGSPRRTTRAASSVRSSGVLPSIPISTRFDLFSAVRSAVRVMLAARVLVVSDSTVLTRTALVLPGHVIRVCRSSSCRMCRGGDPAAKLRPSCRGPGRLR
jgi:hypothetical protein